jgi:hypothetical protein
VPPQTVRAGSLPSSSSGQDRLSRGTRVGNGFSGTRTFATRRDGFALGNLSASEGGPMYPLATTDGGKTWRVAGALVNLPAAHGGVDVAQGGVVSSRLWFMCCGLNTVVDVTTDAGRHWWQAFLPGEVVTVVAGTPAFAGRRARLIAFVRPISASNGSSSRIRPRLWIYTSANGRLWRYDPSQKSIY